MRSCAGDVAVAVAVAIAADAVEAAAAAAADDDDDDDDDDDGVVVVVGGSADVDDGAVVDADDAFCCSLSSCSNKYSTSLSWSAMRSVTRLSARSSASSISAGVCV